MPAFLLSNRERLKMELKEIEEDYNTSRSSKKEMLIQEPTGSIILYGIESWRGIHVADSN